MEWAKASLARKRMKLRSPAGLARKLLRCLSEIWSRPRTECFNVFPLGCVFHRPRHPLIDVCSPRLALLPLLLVVSLIDL
eukprot:5005648-Pyramimonas_sp.AAC.1